jgi:hypothetical protein
MPRLDLILLPVLGGYIFLVTFNITKYYHLRLERQRLIYNSLIVAVILNVIVYFVDYYIFKSNYSINLGFWETKPLIKYRAKLSSWIDSILNIKTNLGLKHSIFTLIIS